eukprot:gene13000-biopygen6914
MLALGSRQIVSGPGKLATYFRPSQQATDRASTTANRKPFQQAGDRSSAVPASTEPDGATVWTELIWTELFWDGHRHALDGADLGRTEPRLGRTERPLDGASLDDGRTERDAQTGGTSIWTDGTLPWADGACGRSAPPVSTDGATPSVQTDVESKQSCLCLQYLWRQSVAAWQQSVAEWRHGGMAAKRGGMAALQHGGKAWRHGGINASGGKLAAKRGGMAAKRGGINVSLAALTTLSVTWNII